MTDRSLTEAPTEAPAARPAEALRRQLAGLGGKDYAAYQSLRGSYRLPPFELRLDRIGKDPYAPSGTGAFGLLVPWRATGLEHDLPSTPARARPGRRSWTAARSP